MEKQALRVGITGGIGSGKTTVCRIFESLGIPVYDADHWAKWLIEHDETVQAGIIALFGPHAYNNGVYDRAYIAGIVFQDAAKLTALNALVHPAVEQHSRAWHAQHTGYAYTLKEAALLIESGSNRYLDRLIVVTAPVDIRIQRVVQRDGLSEAQVIARMERQLPEPEKIAIADFVIVNDGQHALVPQVWQIHQALVLESERLP